MSLALIDPMDRPALSEILKQAWQGGASPGHWREIGQRTAKLLTSHTTQKLALSLSFLLATKRGNRFPECIENLIKAKNDFKHDRGPKIEEDYIEATERVSGLLSSVMEGLSFLTEYPIRLVTDLDGVRGSRRVIVQTRRFSGDHPALPQEKLEYPDTLTKGDLYVQVQDAIWVSLFPFISVHNCPHCKYQETYFVDRWNRTADRATLKSFERGHTIEDSEIANSVGNWIAPEMLE